MSADADAGERAERCETCRFWQPIDARGKCRIRAPRVCGSTSFENWVGFDEVHHMTRFPVTDSDEWCGEWEGREPQTDATVGDLTIRQRYEYGLPVSGIGVREDVTIYQLLSSAGVMGLRVANALRGRRVMTVSQLCYCTAEKLGGIQQVGHDSIQAIRAALAARGLKLRGDP